MKFRKVRLCDLCSIVTDYVANGSFKTLANKVKYLNEGYARVIRLVDYNNKYSKKDSIWVSKESYEFLKKSKLYGGEIVLTNVGANLGTVFIAPQLEYPTTLGPNAIMIKTNENDKYLYYWLKSKNGQNTIKSIVTGSAMPKFNKTDLKNIEIAIPCIEDQDKIVEILSNIDKKIELNNQTNDNLYKMMKIKFEDWITNINKYEVSSLSKIANYTNGLAMQKFRPKDNEESLPVIKIKEMNDGITENTERCSTNIKDEVIINNGDVLFAWSGTLCMSIWGKGKAGLNQHIFKVTSDKYPKWFYYFWTLKHLNKFKMIAAGKATTMGHIKRGELDISEVLIPEDKELQEMHKIMQPLFNKYINNLIQNETLTQLRDTLLPKLMNGEIDLDKIEN